MAQTMIPGQYRITHVDANDNVLNTIVEKHSTEFGGSVGSPATDPQVMPKVKKEMSPVLKEDDKLIIQLKPTTTVTEHSTSSAAANTVRVPVTFKNLRTGNSFEKTLTTADFTDKRAYANSQAWTSGYWYTIYEYTVPAQSALKVGHRVQDARVDSALNLQKDVTTS